MNYQRRAIAVVATLAPLALLGASLLGIGTGQRHSRVGIGLMVAGLLFAAVNLSIAFLRPLLYALRRGSSEGMRHISGIPILGNLFVVAGALVGYGDRLAAILGLAAMALDIGGIPWFVVGTWWDRSFWDD